jgi:hypothetical protein
MSTASPGLGLLVVAGILSAGVTAPVIRAQGGGRDREVMAQFDRDHNGRLDAAERQSAFSVLRFQTSSRDGRGRNNWGPADAGVRLSPSDVQRYPESVPLFDRGTLRTLFIEFEDANWEPMMAAFHRTDIEMPARVMVDGQTFEEVGIHFRGNSSFSSVPDGYKRSMLLSLDWVHGDQEFLGHNKLRLLNANEDPSFMRGILALEVARSYYMAPRGNLIRVVINGENWGIYMNVEHFNGDMTGEWFSSGRNDARWKVPAGGGGGGGRGTLAYLGDNLYSYQGTYEIKSDDDPAQWEALKEMTRILNQTPPDRLEEALEGVLDVDGALRFLAVDNVLVSSDGFWTKGADYAIYRDFRGVFHVLQHDINEFFLPNAGRGGSTRLSPLVNANDSSKALAYRLLAVPSLRERYLGYVQEISRDWLDWDKIGPIVREYDDLIRRDVFLDTKKLFFNEDYVAGVEERPVFSDRISLHNFVTERRRYLDSYFSGQ